MTDTGDSLAATKLLTYVFGSDAPLPSIERLELTDGLYLAPIPPFLLKRDDDYHLLSIKPHFSDYFGDHLHRTTLNVTFQGRKDLNHEGVNSEETIAERKINHWLLAAIVYSPHFLVPYAVFVTIPDGERVCSSNRMKAFGPLACPETVQLGASDFAAINQHYMPIRDMLVNGALGRLPTALRYYQQAFRTDIDWSVRFLGLMMAMEALFSHGASEVSHQVSERTAFFLRQAPQDREGLYEQMRSHYKLRSKIAHGGGASGTQEELESSFARLLQTVREGLVKILVDESLITLFKSDRDQFNSAMRNLIFRGTAVGASSPPAMQRISAAAPPARTT